jgi:transposase
MKGTRDLGFYQLDQIKRVRLVKRADCYYVQFCVSADRTETVEPTGKAIGLDVGLKGFYTDSEGISIENPRFLRRSEKVLKRFGLDSNNTWGDQTSTLVGASLSEQVRSLNQESPSL